MMKWMTICLPARLFGVAMACWQLTVGLTLAGTHLAQSGFVAVDTRDTTIGPVIERIDGLYFDEMRHAFFLSGIGVQEQIDVDVNWGPGQPPGTLLFKMRSSTVQSGLASTLLYNVGSLQAGERITVQAVSADGAKRSVVKTCNFSMVPTPPFLANLDTVGSLFDVVGQGELVEYSIRVGNQWDFWAEDLSSIPKDDQGNDIPGCTGETMKWNVSITAKGSVKSDGSYKVTVSYQKKGDGAGWNVVGHKIEPKISGGIYGSYTGAAWSLGGHGQFTLGGRHESPPLYLWHMPPVYAEAYFAYSVGAGGQFGWHSTDGLEWNIVLPAEFLIGLIAGVGLDDVVAVEVFGGGGPYFTLHLHPVDLHDYGVKFEYGLRLIFLFYTKEFAGEHKLNLKDLIEGNSAVLAASPEVLGTLNWPRSDGFSLLPRDYLSRGAVRVLPMGNGLAAGISAGVTVLQADGYPYSNPALAVSSDSPSSVWLWDDPGRTAENRTVLVCQTKTNGAWSTSSPVWDDGTADFAPALGACTGSLVAAWQNTSYILADGAPLEEAFAAQEIAAGVCVGPGWLCTNLTDNVWLDHSPKLAVADDGSALLCWISNPGNNPSGSASQPNDVMFSTWDGTSWSAPAAVATNVGMLLWSTVAYDGANGIFVCCRDMDDDQGSDADQELFAASYSGSGWTELARLTNDDARDTNPQAVYDAGGKLLLAWFRDGELMTDTDLALANAVAAGTLGMSSAAADYRLLTGPNGELAAVWEAVDAMGQNSPRLINYDRALAAWSQPTEWLSNSNRLERSFSGAFDAAGRLQLAYNSVHISTDSNGLPRMGEVDLCVLEHALGRDLAIADGGLAITPANPLPGSTVDVSVAVANLGEEGITNVTLAVYDGRPAEGGSVIWGTHQIASVLLGGASTNVSFGWVVPTGAVVRTLVAIADPGLGVADDRNRSNNIAEHPLLRADVEVRSAVSSLGPSSERVLAATVANTGGLPLTNAVAVTFRQGSATGTAVGTTLVHPVECGSEYAASVTWDLSGGTFTSAYETVWVLADESNALEETSEENNAGTALVMTTLDSDGDGLLDGQELQYGTRTDLADTDSDGLGDRAEISVHGTDPTVFDTDGDGSSDGHEIAAGTDPHSTTDVFKIVSAEGSTNYLVYVSWNAKSGTTYRVEMAEPLRGDTWTNAPDGEGAEAQSLRTAVFDGVLRYCDTMSVAPTNRFYRIRIEP